MKTFKEFISEEPVSSGDVRGLGFVSGNPAVNTDGSAPYIQADNKNDSIFKHLKQHSKEFNKVKFVAFERKPKTGK